MIVMHHPTASEPPPWLASCPALHVGAMHGGGILCGVGESYHLGMGDGPGEPFDDGWRCWVMGGNEPSSLRRRNTWCDMSPVMSSDDEIWMAPVILTPMAERAYRPRLMGSNFIPTPSHAQAEAEDIARAARTALIDSVNEGRDIPIDAAARWSAILLSVGQHVSPSLIGAIGLLDEHMIRQILIVASGVMPIMEAAHAEISGS